VANPSPLPATGSPPGPLARLQEQLDAPVSKRDFLRGRVTGAARDDRG
jgi:hypothetical protein